MNSFFKLKREDVEISHLKGSGPGGQNKNKRMTGIRMVHLPTGISILSTESRTQGQNLTMAWQRLSEKVAKYFFVPKKRVKTKIRQGAKEERIKNKKMRSVRKKDRNYKFKD